MENLQAENKYKLNSHQTKVFDGEGGSLRHELNLLKYELKQAKKKLYEFEHGSKKKEISGSKNLTDYIQQMADLENENDRLKRIIRDSHDPEQKNAQTKIKAEYMVLKQQIDQLKSQNKLLKEDVRSKENIVQKLKMQMRNNPSGINPTGAQDVEAMENLRRANERLMEQMVKLQEGLNSSMMSRSHVQPGRLSSRSKADFLKNKGKWVNSEWVSKHPGAQNTTGVHFGASNGFVSMKKPTY